jgi:hypothetical protein
MANYANIQNFGNPLDPEWQKRNLLPVTSPNGQTWNVHKDASTSFQNFLKDLTDAGYNPTSSGGFNYRNIRGTDKLSQHAFGNAIDINAGANPMGSAKNDLPANVGELAAKHGLEWGGTWKNPDPMHFEWKGPQDQTQPNTAVASSAPSPSTGLLASLFGGSSAPVKTPTEIVQNINNNGLYGRIASAFGSPIETKMSDDPATQALQAYQAQSGYNQATSGLASLGGLLMQAGAGQQQRPAQFQPPRRPQPFAGFSLLG